MNLERIQTSDGSFTYVDKNLDVSYRSLHGAESESTHVFLEGTRLHTSSNAVWSVLELGFGTGMNFSTTYRYTKENNIKLEYYSLEPSLMPIEDLLIPDAVKNNLLEGAFLSEDLSLNILDSRWQDCNLERAFDAYYHDPFGPKTSPECWTKDCFKWAFDSLNPTGRLATYGASTAARKAMAAAGFVVAKRPGAGRKREMTVAAKYVTQLGDLKILKFSTK